MPETYQQELIRKVAALQVRRFGRGDHARELYSAYDADHDGRLTHEELRRLLGDADVGNALTRGAWVSGIFERTDTDRDGSLTFEEIEGVVRDRSAEPAGPMPPPAPPPRRSPPPPAPSTVPTSSPPTGSVAALAVLIGLAAFVALRGLRA